MALVASIAVAATPRFSKWHARDRVDAAARALLASLTLARGEAVARGASVIVCPVDDAVRCLPKAHACAQSAFDWSCGWAVLVDSERSARALRVHRRVPGVAIAASPAEVEFTPPAGQVIGGFRSFEFAAAGYAASEPGDTLRRCIRIAAGGRARLDRSGCGRKA